VKLALSLAQVTTVGLLVAGAVAQAKRVGLKDLPAVVQKAIQEEIRAEVLGVAEEKEGGKIVYEVESRMGGRALTLTFDTSGQVVEREQEIDIASVPAPARAAIQKAAAGGTIEKVESVTRNGGTSYEAGFRKPGKKREEVLVASDGTIQKH